MSDSSNRSTTTAHASDPLGPGVTRFFILALGITWLLQTPGVLAQKGLLPGGQDPYMAGVMLGIFVPFVATYLVLRREGPTRWRDLFRSPAEKRPSIVWLLGALLLPGVLLSGALVLHRVAGGSLPLAYLADPPGRLVVGVLIATVEEVGWRGFALPRISRALGRVRGTLVLGVVWTVWHFPMLIGQGVPPSLFPLMFVFFVAGSVVFTWVYFRTSGSLLACILLHLGAHLNNSHLPLPGEETPVILHTIAYVILAGCLLMFDRKTFFPGAREA